MAFEHLNDPIGPLENSKTYMEFIMEKVFPKGSPSNYSAAFTIAIVKLFLDPHSSTEKMNEKIVASKMSIYLNHLNEE
ncbi:unnamed protein product [Rhizophagus irregularis]|nr:unnamed protein product [Rhizophagus irregularis]CAB5352163.1 unnamed protein product [Rhizophagus irregularis]